MDNLFELTAKDTKTLQERALKLCEEAGEVAQAVLSATGAPGSTYKKLELADVREEAVDTMIVALAVLAQASDSDEMFQAELTRLLSLKVGKWQETLTRT
ncbi:MazG-like family protein [Roseibium sp. CAU 1637]|uniref:MazG-like family protein n=1 Tax=Roseibium limicola TaxID=2816037 RepID=A0A939ERC6_9HYPH|nr:MazG-like family protein [Roseibium limicola]